MSISRKSSAMLAAGLMAACTVAATTFGATSAAADPAVAKCGLDGKQPNFTWTACAQSNDRVRWVDQWFQVHYTCVEFGRTKTLGSVLQDNEQAYASRVGSCP